LLFIFYSFTSIFSIVSWHFSCFLHLNISLVFVSGCQCSCRKCTHSNVLFMFEGWNNFIKQILFVIWKFCLTLLFIN
jgi:hypothetical protein